MKLKKNFLILLILLLFTLWDIYSIHLGKIFDVLGFLTLLILLFKDRKIHYIKGGINQLILIFYLLGCMLSFLYGNFQEATVVFLGLLTLIFFYNYNMQSNNKVTQNFVVVFYIIIFFQFLHFIYYQLTGISIQFYPSSLFSPPRNYSEDLNFFRATGFFAEANAIVTTTLIFNIVLLSLNYRNMDTILIFTIISNAIAKSLYGFIFIPIYFLMIKGISATKKFIIGVASFGVIFYSFDFSIFIFRLRNFDTDQSFNVRLGIGKIEQYISELLIPSGFDIQSSSEIGINGLYFLANSYGLFLVPLLILWYLSSYKRVFFLLIMLLGTYQMFTSQLFWAASGIILSQSLKNAKKESPPS